MKNITIRLFLNSQVVGAALKRKGSARSIPIRSWVQSILVLIARRKINLVPIHILGSQNVGADLLSRDMPVATEGTLSQAVFEHIV